MQREISSVIGKQTAKQGGKVMSVQHPKNLSSIYILPNRHSGPESKQSVRPHK